MHTRGGGGGGGGGYDNHHVLIQHGEMYVNISHHKDHGISADSY